MFRSPLITRWNVAALIVVMGGTAATLLTAHLTLHRWGGSGIRLSIGEEHTVELPAGECHVYYQSPVAVPRRNLILYVRDEDGEWMHLGWPQQQNSFLLRGSGVSGRALWTLRIDEPGHYTISCYNATYMIDEDVPEGDRVVLFKNPDTLEEMTSIRRRIMTAGALGTVLPTGFFYLAHIRLLRSRRDENEVMPNQEETDA